MAEFLVELYVSRADTGGTERELQRARRTAAALTAQGRPVRLVRSLFVPEDETCFLLVEAETAEAVREAATRAALPYERLLVLADGANDDPPDPA